MQQVLHHRVKYVATLQCVSTVAQNHPGHSICKPQVHPRFDIYTKGISHSYDTLIYYLKQQKLRSGCFLYLGLLLGRLVWGDVFVLIKTTSILLSMHDCVSHNKLLFFF